jgi:hypothetical protein
MFVSVGRDTMASLASGANPMTVFAQQMPQVLQAFTMMGMSMRAIVALALPIVAITAAVAGLGYVLGKMAMNLAGDNPSAKMRDRMMEEKRLGLRKRVDEMRAEKKLQEEGTKENEANIQKDLEKSRALGDAMVKTRIAEAKTPQEAKRILIEDLQDKVKIAKMDAGVTESDLYSRNRGKKDVAIANAMAYESAKEALANALRPDLAAKAGGKLPITEQQRLGAFIGGPQVTMIDLQRKQLVVTQQMRDYMKNMVGRRGPNFGGR